MFLPDAWAEVALTAIYRGEAPPPMSRWLGVSTTVPALAADGSGYTGITEPAAASYGRVEVPPTDWVVTDRAAQVVVQLPDPVDDLGVAVAWVLFDAETGGTPTDAGVPAQSINLPAGATNVTVTCRIESPDNLTDAF